METLDLLAMRESYTRQRILLCFNGPISRSLIEEIGHALRNYLHAEQAKPSEAMDVFAVYIEMTQNIRHYANLKGYGEHEAAATVAIARNEDGHYVVSAGNLVERRRPEPGAQHPGHRQPRQGRPQGRLQGAATPPARQRLRQRSRSRPAGHRPQVQRTTGRIAEGTARRARLLQPARRDLTPCFRKNTIMSDLHIPGTQSTPAIQGDWQAGRLSMQGDSYPENSYELFGQVIDWVERFLADGQRPLELDLRLLYLNTSSIKAMMDILDLLEEAHQGGRPVSLRWHYDRRNERVAELAEEFREDCSFPFAIQAHDE